MCRTVWLMFIWPMLIGLTCAGCQRGPTTMSPKAAEVEGDQAVVASEPSAEQQDLQVPTQQAAEAERIFETLTSTSWTTLPPKRPAFPPLDYSMSTFRADGTWYFDFFTDHHIPTKTGKWNLQFVQGQWFLCQDDGGRATVAINDDGTLALGFGKLYPHEQLMRLPEQTAQALPPLQLLPEVQEIARRLTAKTWKRANDVDLRREPTSVSFRPDWTYSAIYRGGACKSEGTWYAKDDEVVATSPSGRCDDRPGTGGDTLTAKVIDDRKILVNWDLYVPEHEPVPRGIIWGLFGFEQVEIRVEYDMPIRRGMPVRFDVTITNSGREPLQLERFSLSRAYSDYGRSLGDGGKQLVLPDDEIVNHDLAGRVLDPSESHSFDLTAEWEKAGLQWVYFNSLVTGASQNWDVHQAHELTVNE
jgi:hypothetical protein